MTQILLIGVGIVFLIHLWSRPVRAEELYQNPDSPHDDRVEDLVGRMTLEEKIAQMSYEAPAIERLNVPEYNWWNECLHGVARAGIATVFPQAIALAAMWDSDGLNALATAISDEARAKHHQALRLNQHDIYQGLTFWSPNINIFRDPRWGRGMETYGEDPYLAGQLGVSFVQGLQGTDSKHLKLVATPKHFAVHSGPEPARHTFDAQVSEQDLRETYLPHFRDCIVDGRAQSVMCAYNRFRGDPCCGSETLLHRILRDEWGFEGYVVSDCWAILDFWKYHAVTDGPAESAALAVRSGTDLNCGNQYPHLLDAVRQGLISEELIDKSVKRLFRARFLLGMFDPPERVLYAHIPMHVVDSPKHRQLNREAAQKSMVLLKNADNLLPLDRDSLTTIAVIGPNADDNDVLVANYNGTPSYSITPLQGIRDRFGDQGSVLYARGCEMADGFTAVETVPEFVLQTLDGQPGTLMEIFDNDSLSGSPVQSRVSSRIAHHWDLQGPVSGPGKPVFSVRWTGVLIPKRSARYKLGVKARYAWHLEIEGKEWVDGYVKDYYNFDTRVIHLEAGQKYPFTLDYRAEGIDAGIELVWAEMDADLEQNALDLAQEADVVVLCMGLSPRLEGEEMPIEIDGFNGGDRTHLRLPATQRNLIQKIHDLEKPTILVLMNGSALSIEWEREHIPAIVEAWYPGPEGGNAIADLLFGQINPAGRLPVTFYRSVQDLPDFDDYDMAGRTYRYFQGDPLFPFGHGLSYTEFKYRNLIVSRGHSKSEEIFTVSVSVTNTGGMAGDEVVQLYCSHIDPGFKTPIRSLKGFQRIHLKAGETRTVTFLLNPRHLSLVDPDGWRRVIPGMLEISVGGKQPGFTGLADSGTTMTIQTRIQIEDEVLIQ
jgi:beta-glucosidase